MTATSVVRLPTGYWHVRFGKERFVQWPVGRPPTAEDGFGDLTEAHIREAGRLTSEDK